MDPKFTHGETLVCVSDLHFSYDPKSPLLQGVNLELRSGEICCLMGPNGSGKSTLIDSILGDHELSKGSVHVAGKAIDSFKPVELARYLSYVPQSHDASFPYKVRHVVLMGSLSQRDTFDRPSQEDKDQALEILDLVGISHLARRPYTQISGGETQLVMLARALAQDANLIIMDEPTAHLDFKNELIFMQTVRKLVESKEIGVLIATHSPNLAFYFESTGIKTRVAMLDEGKISRDGAPSEVLTEKALLELYGIKAKILSGESDDGKEFHVVAPLSTKED